MTFREAQRIVFRRMGASEAQIEAALASADREAGRFNSEQEIRLKPGATLEQFLDELYALYTTSTLEELQACLDERRSRVEAAARKN